MTYNRDMQEDKEPLFEAADQLSGSLEMARVVVDSVKLQSGACRAAAAEESWVVATDLAEALARAGTPFHQAHQIVGRLVLESVRARQEAGGLDRRRSWRRSRPSSRATWPRCSIPREGMKSREIPGGTGPDGGCRGAGGRPRAPGADARMTKSFRQGQILKLIRAKADLHAGRTGAGAEEARHRRHAGDALARHPRAAAW